MRPAADGGFRGVKSSGLLLQKAPTTQLHSALKGHLHALSGRQSTVSDPESVRARAMETLFERLESLCEGAIAIDRVGRVVYVNEKYLHSLRASALPCPMAGW